MRVDELTDRPDAAGHLLIQMLGWIDARPRTYGDSMDAWRSSCPRHPVWDDALIDGLVRIEAAGSEGMSHAMVVLTDAGREALAGRGMAADG
jgi:hypothetical protein